MAVHCQRKLGAMGMEVNDDGMAGNLHLEFQDPQKVKVTQGIKYGLFFISLGLFLSTVVAISMLAWNTGFHDSSSTFYTTELPNLDQICATYDFGGRCFAHMKHEPKECRRFTCSSYSIQLYFEKGKYVYKQDPFEIVLHVPNGYPCAPGHWCVGGSCVPSSHPGVTKQFMLLNSTQRPGGMGLGHRCLQVMLGHTIERLHNQIEGMLPDKKFCASLYKDDQLSLPAIKSRTCDNPVPKGWTVQFCSDLFPFVWEKKSYSVCQRLYKLANGTDVRDLMVDPDQTRCRNDIKTKLPDGHKCETVEKQAGKKDGMCFEGICIPFES